MTTPREDAITGDQPDVFPILHDNGLSWDELNALAAILDRLGLDILPALAAAPETPDCSICRHGPDPHYTGCMECDRYGRDHTL